MAGQKTFKKNLKKVLTEAASSVIVRIHTLQHKLQIMRTKTLLCFAAAIAAGVATSMAQSNVYSLNVVGYVNKPLPTGLTLVANPLNTTNNTITGLFGGVGGALPEGTQVFLWNGTGYGVGTRDDLGAAGWSPDGFETTDLSPGKGFFVKNNSGAPFTNTFIGEVLQGSLTNHVGTGFQLLGSKVPLSGQVDDVTKLGFPVTDGDQVYQWSGTTYAIFTADSLNTPPPWGDVVPNIGVAEGFFSRKAAATDWVRNFTVQ